MTGADDLFRATPRLLVFGYFGGRNFGDELMLLGLIEEARSKGVGTIRIITPDGCVPGHLAGQIDGAYPKSIGGLIVGLWWASALAFCGGTVFHDAFPASRYRQYRSVLMSLAALCCIARLMGRRVLLVSVGIGPLRRGFTKMMTRLALMAAHEACVRDKASADDLAMIGVKPGKVRITNDLALSAKPALPPALPKSPPTLVLSIVAPGITSTVPEKDAGVFVDMLGEELQNFLARARQWRLAILEVAVGRYDNDHKIAAALAKRMEPAAPGRVNLLRFDGNPHIFLETLGGAAMVIASRYHIATAAELIGVPTLWLPYQRKVVDGARALAVPGTRILLPRPNSVAPLAQWIRDQAVPFRARCEKVGTGFS